MSFLHSIISVTTVYVSTISLNLIVLIFLVVNVSEFNFIVILIMCWISSEEAWLAQKHAWNANNSNDEENQADFHLLLKTAYIANAIN